MKTILLSLALLAGSVSGAAASDSDIKASWFNPDGTFYVLFENGDWGYMTTDGDIFLSTHDGDYMNAAALGYA